MSKTKAEVIARAQRVLGVLAADENPTADDSAFAEAALDGIYDELETVHGLHLTFALDSVPDGIFLPFADLLASEMAAHYAVPGPDRSRALTRVRAYASPDDR